MRIGKAILIVRRARRLRASDVARAAEISNPTLSLIENGEREPSLRVLERIARALDVPAEALILMSRPRKTTLISSDEAANGLAKAVRRLVNAEKALRQTLETEFCLDARS